ncbi:probable F-box protein At1g60180 [Lycium ferocissimum]|uniref:probable F-box protein At1g60180 n=1 Tax=Lycium ferocissimum TaxID=112874 RepID=UPI0028152D1C|nr:probable F-box protein At1g60180 [Lycium ferocissimum]
MASKKQKNGLTEDDRINQLPDSLSRTNTSLKLRTIRLDDDDIVKLLSSCPALETLELSMFGGFRHLEINSSNLKRLNLNFYRSFSYEEPDHVLEIFAPLVQHLELTEHFGDLKCRLVNVSSLVTANFTFNICCTTFDDYSCREFHQVFRNLVLDSLQKLTYATEPIIGNWFAKVLFMLQLEGVPLPELRCKCLTIEVYTKFISYGVASLLRTSPFLEMLNIDMGDWCHASNHGLA